MIRQAVLSNGIRVVVESVPEAHKVALRFAFNVGSQNNPRELSGLAHFTEHALFLGTQTYTDKEIQNIERKSGATFNAESNQFDIHSFGQIKNVNNLYEVLESMTPDDIAQMAYRITLSRLSFAGVGNIRKMPSYEQINKWISKSKEKRENELFQQKERQIVMKMSDKNQRIR